jgi:hypothetical protein
MTKIPALFAAVLLATAGCGGADSSVASRSDASTISCTTPTFGSVVPTDCSTLTGADLTSCLIGTPPVCAATVTRGTPGCACTGEGTNLYAEVEAVGLCGRNAEQTRDGLQSSLCSAQIALAKGELAKACVQIQGFERKVFEKQTKALDKDINGADADALRAAAQDIEATIGADCVAVTPVVP